MRNPGKAVPAAVKRWEQEVREYRCVITRTDQLDVHHVFGSTYKHNKILIGPWYLLPLAIHLHRPGYNLNISEYRGPWTQLYGYQQTLFMKMIADMSGGDPSWFDHPDHPSREVYEAILDSPLR